MLHGRAYRVSVRSPSFPYSRLQLRVSEFEHGERNEDNEHDSQYRKMDHWKTWEEHQTNREVNKTHRPIRREYDRRKSNTLPGDREKTDGDSQEATTTEQNDDRNCPCNRRATLSSDRKCVQQRGDENSADCNEEASRNGLLHHVIVPDSPVQIASFDAEATRRSEVQTGRCIAVKAGERNRTRFKSAVVPSTPRFFKSLIYTRGLYKEARDIARS